MKTDDRIIGFEYCNAYVKWTICTVVNPNLNETDAYTNNCIEDTFYPNEICFQKKWESHEKSESA